MRKNANAGIINYKGKFICYKPETWKEDWIHNKSIYFVFIPVLAYLIIFNYIPMVGILMAFENYNVKLGIFGSKWVRMQNFIDLFSGDTFLLVLRNTAAMALLHITIGFVAPIILALIISEVKNKPFRRTVQTISYMPYFVSSVVVSSLAREFLSSTGALTLMLSWFGFDKQNWLANPNVPVFWLINCFIGVWTGAGWGSIIYIAAISNVNGDLHEAAAIDGANRWQRLWRITMPSILPLIVTMFTLSIGMVFKTAFNNVLLLYMPAIYDTADCLSTYTYRMAFGQTVDYGISTASGLFESVLGTTLLLFSNWLSKKVSGSSMI